MSLSPAVWRRAAGDWAPGAVRNSWSRQTVAISRCVVLPRPSGREANALVDWAPDSTRVVASVVQDQTHDHGLARSAKNPCVEEECSHRGLFLDGRNVGVYQAGEVAAHG